MIVIATGKAPQKLEVDRASLSDVQSFLQLLEGKWHPCEMSEEEEDAWQEALIKAEARPLVREEIRKVVDEEMRASLHHKKVMLHEQ